jgi:hypothetical protein
MFITQRPVREWACDLESRIRRLDKALNEAQAKGWTIVECGLMEMKLPLRLRSETIHGRMLTIFTKMDTIP